MRIYIGNLNLETSGPDLEEVFARFGPVASARVAADSEGRSRGFGFVEMTNNPAAKAAIQGVNGIHLRGNRLTVNESEPLDQDKNDWPFDRRSQQAQDAYGSSRRA